MNITSANPFQIHALNTNAIITTLNYQLCSKYLTPKRNESNALYDPTLFKVSSMQTIFLGPTLVGHQVKSVVVVAKEVSGAQEHLIE